MSLLEKLACMQKRKDEVLNQELAKELAQKNDKSRIKVLAKVAASNVKYSQEILPKTQSARIKRLIKKVEGL